MREELIKLRKKEDLTQKEVAELLDITRGYYGHIETGRRNPPLKLALKIANLFEKKVEDIFLIINETNCSDKTRKAS
ncbi:helix-turn-helix transcriptional regulator [Orenia marismortui]|uniref:helix-turn-helix transcriptional regulator n=1 Tax=Orenia marismortui TaxID=46469 RepID=UPI000368216E|nr:helix-turn-helix domain-containing protein [Orenia marismortui]